MFSSVKYLAVVAAFILVAVSAQDGPPTATAPALSESTSPSHSASAPVPSMTGEITMCIILCVQGAADRNGCPSLFLGTDFSCLCTNAFQTDADTCLQTNCTADEVASFKGFQQQQCGTSSSPSGSASASASASGSSVPSSSAATTRPSTTAPATTKPANTAAAATSTSPNAAAGKVTFGYGGLVALGVGAVGLALGSHGLVL